MTPVGLPALLLSLLAAAAAAAERPNIVLIVADDLGWRDPAFMGSDFHRTPALDGLAADGIVFTDAYANAGNCAPSRAAMLSGQYAPRTGVYTVGSADRGRSARRRLLTVPNRTELDSAVVTLGERLAAAGYATASIGKWHLGAGATGPEAQGFALNVGGGRRGHPPTYLSPYGLPGLTDGPPGEHLTERLAAEAARFVAANRDRPFFLYLPSFAVHTPIQPAPHRAAACRDRAPGTLHDHARYAALVEGLDAGVGRVLAAIDACGLRERTVVVFTSDNGGHGRFTSSAPLRGAKGMFYEGGIRVPLVVRWPGVVAAGRRCATPVIGLDLYPTLAAIAGAPATDGQPVDGVDLGPLLRGDATIAPRALFWHFPAYLEAGGLPDIGWWRTTPCGAIRRGRWKLLEFFEDGRRELYDLAADPGETRDLVAMRPAVARSLHAELVAWRTAVAAPVPTEPNPDYDPAAAAERRGS
ncbi:MAG: sulfatase [Planctomycetota bacterium]|jgi:arylsulfatase A-like enzyme